MHLKIIKSYLPLPKCVYIIKNVIVNLNYCLYLSPTLPLLCFYFASTKLLLYDRFLGV